MSDTDNKLKEESDSEAKKLVYNRIPENVMARFARGDYIWELWIWFQKKI